MREQRHQQILGASVTEQPSDYDHANRRDVLLLAQAMLELPEERRPDALARLYDARLIHSAILVHMLGAFGSRILLRAVFDRICHGLPTAVARATRRCPDLRDDAWTAVIEHLVQGRDAQDSRSAGGFGADELARLVDALRGAGWHDPRAITVEGAAVPGTREPPGLVS